MTWRCHVVVVVGVVERLWEVVVETKQRWWMMVVEKESLRCLCEFSANAAHAAQYKEKMVA